MRRSIRSGSIRPSADLIQHSKKTPQKLSHEYKNAEQEKSEIMTNVDTKKLLGKIKQLNQDAAIVNDTIVGILESDSNLFVNLSQCITAFEREFAEFPAKIDSLLSIVSEAASFPAPDIGNIPPEPVLESCEILEDPAWLPNAPLMYDALVQQHRIEESIALVVKCAEVDRKAEEEEEEDVEEEENHEKGVNENGEKKEKKKKIEFTFIDEDGNEKTKEVKPIPSISAWVNKTRMLLKSEIEARLELLPINGPEAMKEILQLKSLGYKKYAKPLFLKLASKSIDKMMPQLKDSFQFLPFITNSTQVLVNELLTTMQRYFDLFNGRRIGALTQWVTHQIEEKLPIYRNDIMPSNFTFMREAVKITKNEVEAIQANGISLKHIFEAMPKRFCELLELSSQQTITEITARISDDQFDIEPEEGKKITLQDYPESKSFEKFKNFLDSFMKDFDSLYEPSIFFDCANLINNVLLSYGEICMELLHSFEEEEEEEDMSDEDSYRYFRSISVQLGKVQGYLFPEVMKVFKRITGFDSPVKQNAEKEIKETIDYVCAIHVKFFFQKWSQSIGGIIPFSDFRWETVGEVDDNFAPALEVITDFISSLVLPQALYEKTVCCLLDQLLATAKEAGYTLENVNMLNSFDFHWAVFSQIMCERFPREALDAFNANIRAIEKEICRENFINESDCMTPMQMMQTVNEFLASEGMEEDN